MTRPPFVPFDGFLETAFERRFLGILRRAWRQRSWHVLAADPGSGKSMGIGDLVKSSGIPSGTLAGRSYPVLAVTAPKNDQRESALGNYLIKGLGLPVRGRWSERKYRLMDTLIQFGVECLIIDDAHDLSLQHLIFLKERDLSRGPAPLRAPVGVMSGHGGARHRHAAEPMSLTSPKRCGCNFVVAWIGSNRFVALPGTPAKRSAKSWWRWRPSTGASSPISTYTNGPEPSPPGSPIPCLIPPTAGGS